MDDKPHIGFINAHAECDSRHNDIHILAQEGILIGATHGTLHAGMIRQRLDIVKTQDLGKFLYLLTAQAIDDARLALVSLNKLDDFAVHILGLGPYFIVQVRTVKRGLEHCSIGHAQVLLDIVLHLGRRRRRQGNDGTLADAVDDGTYIAILRAEIMSPLRDTVCLVNGIEGNGHVLQESHILLLSK